MFESKKDNENVKDLSYQYRGHELKNEPKLIDTLEAIIKSTSDFSLLDKRKLLKEIPNVRNGNTENFKYILLVRINKNKHINDLGYVYGKDENGDTVKISGRDMFSFVHRVSLLNKNKTQSDSTVRNEYDIFVENVLEKIKQYRNSGGDYYDYFQGRYDISHATRFDSPSDAKEILINLYVLSRLNKKNEKLDNELPFLSFDVLLNKYNEFIQEEAKKMPNKTEFIEKYGVRSIIEEGNKIIKDKLIKDQLFKCLDNDGYSNMAFAHNLDLYRATEYMSISEIVSIINNNIEGYNNYKRIHEQVREENHTKYGRSWDPEEKEREERYFENFKKTRLPIIVNVLKHRLIEEGLVSKSIDEKLLEAKICSELLNIEWVFGDYSKIKDIGLKSIISQSDYFEKKKQFETLSPFGILKIKIKQNQLGMPKYARLF